MRFLLGIILLGFPILEIVILLSLGKQYGGWVLVYLVVIGYLGLRLIKDEKQSISANMMNNLRANGSPMKAVLGSARNMIAGGLLLIPGVITDVIAVIMLLIPIKQAPTGMHNQDGEPMPEFDERFTKSRTTSANDDVIEGEYTEVSDDNPENKS